MEESNQTNLHLFIVPNFLLAQTQKSLANFFSNFPDHLQNFQIQNLAELDSSNFSLTRSNLFLGTIQQIINLFSLDLLNPKEIRSLVFDQLDHTVSQGGLGNLGRFVNYLKKWDRNLLSNIFIQINVADDEKSNLKEFKDNLAQKFTSIRILPEEESQDEAAYQMTEKQQKQLLKNQNKKSLLQEFLHQFYYSHLNTNVYSMIYLLLKYKVFPERTLIILEDLSDVYR